MPTGQGVDLHPYYQRGVSALPNVGYGWLKLADGARTYTYRDPAGRVWTPKAHADLFKALKIPFGGYVYAQPGDGALEARVLWSLCQQYGATGVAPGCDIESNKDIHIWSPAEATDHGRAFCSQVRKLGVRPAIYMNDDLAGRTNPDAWPEDPVLWIARYGAKPTRTRYDIHQYSSTGTLPGSAGAVDWNQAYTNAHLLTEEEIMAFTGDDFAALMWGNVFDANGNRNFAQFVKDMDVKLTALAAKAGGASAEEIAAKLLPALTSALIAEVSQVDAISDEDAQQIAEAVTKRAGALLAGTQ